MIDSLLLKLVNRPGEAKNLDAMQADRFESPDFYSSWISPLRYLLAARYLKHKTAIIESFTEQGIYPVHQSEYIPTLKARLEEKAWFGWLKNPGYWFSPFSSIVFYPLLIAALIFGSWHLHQWYLNKNVHLALADRMPFYSELLHRTQVAKQHQRFDLAEEFLEQAKQERNNIVSLVPDKGIVRQQLKTALDSMQDDEQDNSQIMVHFKNLNLELDKQKIPYYVSPKLFSTACSSLAPSRDAGQIDMFNTLKDLFEEKNPTSSLSMCRTGIITVYNVTDRRGLDYLQSENIANAVEDAIPSGEPDDKAATDNEELPLFHVTRADRVPAADGALGLTFKNQGVGSIILLDQIKRFAEESVLPALTFQGRSFIIPYWLQGYYDIEESITKNYKSDLADLFSDPESLQLLRAAAKEMLLDQKHLAASRMQQTLQRSMPGNPSSQGTLSGGLDALSSMMAIDSKEVNPAQKAAKIEIDALTESLLPSIEYHEAYHQIVKDDWVTPSWVPIKFEKLSEQGIESSLEELGAYLTQLVYTNTGHKIWLTKLLLFSLNSMTKDQPEYYASSLIFSAMRDLYLMRNIEPNFELTIDEKVAIYEALSTYSPMELNQLAEQAFEELFERPVVRLE